MPKDKLKKFDEFRNFVNTYDFPYHLKGKWNTEVFGNDHPITLELGCGKGEYTIALGRAYPDRNFIGVDIKSNRMWKGASIGVAENLHHIAFMRATIDRINELFGIAEVAEIWITFPDPYPKDRHAKHRLIHPRFLRLYRHILAKGGLLHLKTDDDGLFDFTSEMLPAIGIAAEKRYTDVHADSEAPLHLKNVRTYYENLFMGKGRTIKYLSFTLEDFDQAKADEWERAWKKRLKTVQVS